MAPSISVNSRKKSSTAKAELFIPIMTNFKAYLRMEIVFRVGSSTIMVTTMKENLLKDSTMVMVCSSVAISHRKDYSEMASLTTVPSPLQTVQCMKVHSKMERKLEKDI